MLDNRKGNPQNEFYFATYFCAEDDNVILIISFVKQIPSLWTGS